MNLTPFDPTRRHCLSVGKTDEHAKWYKAVGNHNAYYCEYCATIGRPDILHQIRPCPDDELSKIMWCHTVNEDKVYKVERDGFRVWLTTCGDVGTVPLLLHETEGQTVPGMGFVKIPTYTHYEIHIENLYANTRYTIDEPMVGSRKVIINNGHVLYHAAPMTINGFESGTKSVFQFVSATEFEKEHQPSVVSATHSVTNVISLSLTRYKERKPPAQTNYFHFPETFSSAPSSSSCSWWLVRRWRWWLVPRNQAGTTTIHWWIDRAWQCHDQHD